jgi:hypothetical protein
MPDEKEMKDGKISLSQYIRLLANMLYDLQKVRIALQNRVDRFNEVGTPEHKAKAEELRVELVKLSVQMENTAEKRLSDSLQGVDIMDWLKKVKGIGPRLSGSIVGMIEDITNFDTVSKLWSYFGLGVIEICKECKKICPSGVERPRFLQRQAERRWNLHLRHLEKEGKPAGSEEKESFIDTAYKTSEKSICNCESPETFGAAPDKKYFKGLLITYSPFLRMTAWKISGQFVKQGSFYRRVYEEKKAYYTARDGDRLTPIHIEMRAKRATVKLFLSHLWWMWRLSLGLPVGEIYLQKKLGKEFAVSHTLIEPPHMDVFDK